LLVPAASVEARAQAAAAKDEPKEKEKEKAKPAAKKPAPSYTDEDLKRAREGGGGNVVFLPPPPHEEPDTSSSSGESSGDGEKGFASQADSWRNRAAEHRQAVAAHEEAVQNLEARLGELTNDMSQNPGDLFDPNRLQKREAEKQKLMPELEAAKTELAAAKKAKADFEDEARQKNIPPGWLQP
jgi:hypothetical protein